MTVKSFSPLTLLSLRGYLTKFYMRKLHRKAHPLTMNFNKIWLSANLLAISCELAAYYSLEIASVFTNNMRNICCRTQTLDW